MGKTHKNNKKAFTLAEVLITLGIIGVVAALTMPTLIQKHQNQAYVTGLKKGMSVIENMFKKMQAEGGVSDFGNTELFSRAICHYSDFNGVENACEDAYGNPSVIEDIVRKYMNVVKVCKGSDCNVEYNGEYWCPGSDISQGVRYSKTYYNKMPLDYGTTTTVTGFYTSDGMIYYIIPVNEGSEPDGPYGKRIVVYIDSNGEKGPNIIGKDTFSLGYNSKGKLTSTKDSSILDYVMQNGWKIDY